MFRTLLLAGLSLTLLSACAAYPPGHRMCPKCMEMKKECPHCLEMKQKSLPCPCMDKMMKK